MKILKSIATNQSLSIIPRVYATTIYYTLTDEEKNTSVTVTGITPTTVLGYLSFDSTYTLRENVFYELDVFDSSNDDLIYQGRIFCTDQLSTSNLLLFADGLFEDGLFESNANENYTINKDIYTTDTTYDNEYVIYEG